MNPGLNGILPEGGDAADADAGYHEHERYYECLDEEHDQSTSATSATGSRMSRSRTSRRPYDENGVSTLDIAKSY